MAYKSMLWQHKILRRFNSLRENIDPVFLLGKLYHAKLLDEGTLNIQNNQCRSIKAMQVMISITRKIINESSFNAFEEILRRHQTYCIEILEKAPVSHYEQSKETTVDDNTAVLLNEKSSIVDGLMKLRNEKLLNIIGTFVEELIFNLNDTEECLHYIIVGDERRTAMFLFGKIQLYTDKDSFRCFVYGFQLHTQKHDMSRIRKILQSHLVEDEITKEYVTQTTRRFKEYEKSVIQKVAEVVPNEVGKQDIKVVDIGKGSIVLHLKCGKNLNRKEVDSDFFQTRGILESLLPLLHDEEIQELCPGIAFVIVGCEIIVRSEETDDGRHIPLTLIEANKSFLIEEIDTGILVAAFKRRHIYCFAKHGLDLNADRRTRASKFLEIVDLTNNTKTLMDILKQEGMLHIYERLERYERICETDVDSSTLETSLYLKLGQISSLLEVDDIEEVFLDRGILKQEVFDEINETFEDKSVAIMLLKIISSGKIAMLTLVELLFMKREATLANYLIDSATLEKGLQEKENTKDSSTLEKSLFLKFGQISSLLEVDDIEEVFRDRNTLQEQVFDEMNETSEDKSVAAKLLKIISSGKMVMLILVELLYMKQEATLANGWIDLAIVEKGRKEEENTKDVDSSTLEKSLFLKFKQLSNLLEVDDIDKVFLDRKILKQQVYDEIHETFKDKSVAGMLLKIISSGKMAMLTLVELLYMKRETTLANDSVDSEIVEKGFKEGQQTKEVDSSTLGKSLYLKFRQLSNLLEVDDIEEVFLDRGILKQEVFDEINETCADMSIAGMLLKIISSGKMALLTLVELLHLKREATLANDSVDSETVEKGLLEEKNTKEESKGYDCQTDGTEFCLTIHLVDIKDIDLRNTDVIVKNNSLLPIIEKRSDDARKDDELPDEVQSFYDSQDITKSGCVIHLDRKFMYCDDKEIYSGNCKVIQYALQNSDGVASWYEVQGDNSIIYIQSNKLKGKESDHTRAHSKSKFESGVKALLPRHWFANI